MNFKLNNKLFECIQLSFKRLVLFSLPMIIGLALAPAITYAGFWSAVASIFTGPEASAQTETLASTSSQNSQTMPLLEAATAPDPSLKVTTGVVMDGGEALLAATGPSTSAPDQINTGSDQISVYIIRSGDTLAGIADMFGVSVNTILWANNLTRSTPLQVGQNLVILPVSGVIVTVAKGNTLQSIAKKYNGDAGDIASFNDMAVTDKLSIGDTIIIPDGEASYSVSNITTKSSSKTYEPLLVNVSSLPDYNSYYLKPFIGGRIRSQGLHGHNAVDYSMPTGSSLYAAASGIVIISKSYGYNGGYGEYVAIQHPNGTETVYGHMSNPIVTVGQTVTQGELIGLSGNTGNSTGPHLHFEVRGAKNPF